MRDDQLMALLGVALTILAISSFAQGSEISALEARIEQLEADQ